MTQREGQASTRTTKIAPRPVPASANSSAGTARAETPARTPSWDDLFHTLAPAQREELLGLARRQGLLYAHQLPPSNNGSTTDHARALLGKVLSGRTDELVPLHPPVVECVDAALDAVQREAVAAALATPDLFLLQGLPGTGKSRVVTEIITQAAAKGERILLLAPTVAALDRVLEGIATRPAVCAVRCLDRGERPELLPPVSRRLTFAEQVRSLREQTLQAAQQLVARRIEQTERLRNDDAAWPQLAEFATTALRLDQRGQNLQARLAELSNQIEREVAAAETETPDTPFADRLRTVRLKRLETRTRWDERTAALKKDRADVLSKVAELTAEKDKTLSLAEAKQHGQWWTMRWWQAALQGVTEARCQDLEVQFRTSEEALAALEPKLEETLRVAQEEDQAFQLQHEQLIAEETTRRRSALAVEERGLRKEQVQLDEGWNDLCQRLAPGTPRPETKTAEAIAAARAAWEQAITHAVEEELFAARWADHLAQAPDTLAERLPQFVNLVAATTLGLAGDPQFGTGTTFDLLIVEEAEQVTESEFLALARRARRWVLVGEPRLDTAGPEREEPSAKGPRGAGDRRRSSSMNLPASSSILNRLWLRLHCDPSCLPYSWMQENNRLVCRLRPITPQQRAALEVEHVADLPDVELRILAGTERPTLVEVAFPPTMSIIDAKRYIYHELQELPLRASSQRLSWVEDAQRLTLHLADAPISDPVSVALEEGVRELLGPVGVNGDAGYGPWYTCGVEFDRAAGWHRQRAQEWLARHAGVRDLGRTIRLSIPYRMNPDLARFTADLLAPSSAYSLPTRALSVGGLSGVEFIPVPALARERGGRGRDRERGKPLDVASLLANMRGGAGLELSLEDGRHRDRIPTEVRTPLPARGLVNYLEAQAIVRTLSKLAQDGSFTDGLAALAATEGVSPTVTVLALYPAQVTLLRQLIQMEPQLATARFHLEVETPSAYRHRDALVVLVSLTRSHTHRAVPFGEGPDALLLALSRARARLLLFGDPGTLVRRTQWEGALDHLDAAEATRERELIALLVRYLQGQGSHPQVFSLREGNPA